MNTSAKTGMRADTTSDHRPARGATVLAAPRRPSSMPRSTTRVIWTRGEGTVVEYGEVR